jgi:MoaA/NifB/PqqE/SkfB family radical SAM enzyme
MNTHELTQGTSSFEFKYDKPVHLQITCANLRHKLMYVDARHTQRGVTDDSSRTRIFWCSKTQDALGPDGEPVNPVICTGSRPCYRE